VNAAIARVVADGPWILGPSVEAFESEFAAYLGANHVVGVGNGTDALAIAFTALDLPRGSGVLVAANEGGYAATAARLAGLVPVEVDVDEFTMVPTVEQAEAAASSAASATISALVVTHLHGEASDIRALDEWRRTRGFALIEDCAQAHGARLDGVHVGLSGDAATFSFYPTKNLGAIGDGGAIAFTDSSLAERARALRQYGWGERYRVEVAGGRNSRLDPLQAAVLSARLPFLDGRNTVRREISAAYRKAVVKSDARIHGNAETTVAHHSVIVTPQRDALAALLDSRGIQSAVHYPHTLSEMPGLEIAVGAEPSVAAGLRDRMLSLPSFPEMTDAEIAHVTDTLKEWANG